jgi:hypothetical protein
VSWVSIRDVALARPGPTLAPLPSPCARPLPPPNPFVSFDFLPHSNLPLPLPPLSPRGALGFGVEIAEIWIPRGEFPPSPSLSLSLSPPPPLLLPRAASLPALRAASLPALRAAVGPAPAPPLSPSSRAAPRPCPAPPPRRAPPRPCPLPGRAPRRALARPALRPCPRPCPGDSRPARLHDPHALSTRSVLSRVRP